MAGAVVFAVLLSVFGISVIVFGATLNLSPGFRFDSDAAILLDNIGIRSLTSAMVGAAVLTAATGLASRGQGVFPRRFGWSSFVVAGLSLLSVALFVVPVVVFGIWIMAVSVLMLKGEPNTTGT